MLTLQFNIPVGGVIEATATSKISAFWFISARAPCLCVVRDATSTEPFFPLESAFQQMRFWVTDYTVSHTRKTVLSEPLQTVKTRYKELNCI